jgi:hypothetical protein
MMVYVAGSCRRRDIIDPVFDAVRGAGHVITFDWRDSVTPEALFGPDHESMALDEMAAALNRPLARGKFALDRDGIEQADVLVLVLPSGRSAAVEFGVAVGRGKPAIVYAPAGARMPAELMLAYARGFAASIPELLRTLDRIAEEDVVGPSDHARLAG